MVGKVAVECSLWRRNLSGIVSSSIVFVSMVLVVFVLVVVVVAGFVVVIVVVVSAVIVVALALTLIIHVIIVVAVILVVVVAVVVIVTAPRFSRSRRACLSCIGMFPVGVWIYSPTVNCPTMLSMKANITLY